MYNTEYLVYGTHLNSVLIVSKIFFSNGHARRVDAHLTLIEKEIMSKIELKRVQN